jgi:hypothetical protein
MKRLRIVLRGRNFGMTFECACHVERTITETQTQDCLNGPMHLNPRHVLHCLFILFEEMKRLIREDLFPLTLHIHNLCLSYLPVPV